jgi:hypothetical protein
MFKYLNARIIKRKITGHFQLLSSSLKRGGREAATKYHEIAVMLKQKGFQ